MNGRTEPAPLFVGPRLVVFERGRGAKLRTYVCTRKFQSSTFSRLTNFLFCYATRISWGGARACQSPPPHWSPPPLHRNGSKFRIPAVPGNAPPAPLSNLRRRLSKLNHQNTGASPSFSRRTEPPNPPNITNHTDTPTHTPHTSQPRYSPPTPSPTCRPRPFLPLPPSPGDSSRSCPRRPWGPTCRRQCPRRAS